MSLSEMKLCPTFELLQVRGTHVIEDGSSVWAAIGEDGVTILSQGLKLIAKYSLSSIQTFGGTPDDNFMVVIDDSSKKRRLVFSGISKIKVSTKFITKHYSIMNSTRV